MVTPWLASHSTLPAPLNPVRASDGQVGEAHPASRLFVGCLVAEVDGDQPSVDETETGAPIDGKHLRWTKLNRVCPSSPVPPSSAMPHISWRLLSGS